MAYQRLLSKSGGRISEDDPANGKYAQLVHQVGKELAAKSPRDGLNYEFALVNSDADNAWCLPGGKIAINLGLVLNMEKETNDFGMEKLSLKEKVAAVLSHEISHASARHGGRTIERNLFIYAVIKALRYLFENGDQEKEHSEADRYLDKIIQGSLALCQSREHEYEADKYGMHLMKSANINPRAAIWLMEYFKEHHQNLFGIEFLSTHPLPEGRLEKNKETFQELNPQKVV
ncbi:MAG: M48 family metalloprotease [Parachlamydiales bacterium]|nr:M48 family metalloprotease [Parachlamydiales bacterium]